MTTFIAPPTEGTGTATRDLGGPTAPGTSGTWIWEAGLVETIVTRPPGGTLTGRLPLPLLLGLRATGWPDTATWVVIGLNTPAGFCVTMVLVAPDPVGERAGLAVVTSGPVGLKLTAAIGTRAGPGTVGTAPALVTLV